MIDAQTDLATLVDNLKWIVGVVWFLVAFVSGRSTEEIPPPQRALLGLAVLVGIAIAWPRDLGDCSVPSSRLLLAIILAVLAAALFVTFWWIDTRHTYQQERQDEDHKVTKKIVGGRLLTAEARFLIDRVDRTVEGTSRHPTEQEIFARLGFDPLRMWDRASRSRMKMAYKASHHAYVFLGALATLCVAASFLADREIARLHQLPSITPSELILRARQLGYFVVRFRECNPKLRWAITPSVGSISALGIYKAPDKVASAQDVAVSATTVEHEHTVIAKVELRGESSFVESRKELEGGTAGTGGIQKYEVIVIDKTYSWIWQKSEIAGGVEPSAFVHSLARDGLFDAYEEIICVGAASREYIDESRERNRAMERARLLRQWVSAALEGRGKMVRALSIGRYASNDSLSPEATKGERQIVLIGVPRRKPGVDLVRTLIDAFERKVNSEPLYRMYLDHYPRPWRLEPDDLK